jgi:poly [ADP-ribose] polymerase
MQEKQQAVSAVLPLFRMQASHAVCNTRATKGVGATQHTNWQDAGIALGHKELEGVYMPKGEATYDNSPGGGLMYNEVRDRDKTFLR